MADRKTTHVTEYNNVDREKGEYLPLYKIWEREGKNAAGLVAAQKIVLKCLVMGGKWIRWNDMTERYDFLYIKIQYIQDFRNCWSIYRETVSDHTETNALENGSSPPAIVAGAIDTGVGAIDTVAAGRPPPPPPPNALRAHPEQACGAGNQQSEGGQGSASTATTPSPVGQLPPQAAVAKVPAAKPPHTKPPAAKPPPAKPPAAKPASKAKAKGKANVKAKAAQKVVKGSPLEAAFTKARQTTASYHTGTASARSVISVCEGDPKWHWANTEYFKRPILEAIAEVERRVTPLARQMLITEYKDLIYLMGHCPLPPAPY